MKNTYFDENDKIIKKGYSLVICEKPEAAKKIAEALSNNTYRTKKVTDSVVFNLNYKGKELVICSALGHLYKIKLAKTQSKLSIFDYSWIPINKPKNKAVIINSKINLIKLLSKDAKEFILACDLDQEGETIGYNILKYACNEKQKIAKRVKFSTLTEKDIKNAFSNMEKHIDIDLAIAGRTRHVIDCMYGINISKALSLAFMSYSNKYRTLSIGRVQGPTIAYVVENDLQIETHVPLPFWGINAYIETTENGKTTWLKIKYKKEKIIEKNEANNIIKNCKGEKAIISKINKNNFKINPPVPFNLSELQKKAFRLYKLNPYQTLNIAEKLYLKALISYPRTTSQKLPTAINYRKIISDLSKLPDFTRMTNNLLKKKKLTPTQGKMSDNAHPSIYPTGKMTKFQLSNIEKKIFNLIVTRFLELFEKPIIGEINLIHFNIGKYIFLSSSKKIKKETNNKHNKENEKHVNFQIAEKFNVKRIRIEENFETAPRQFNQITLMEKMEKENVGTKSTRANIIQTIIDRAYIKGTKLKSTHLARALVEVLQIYSPLILSSEMTRKMEKQLEEIENRKTTQEKVLTISSKNLSLIIKEIQKNNTLIGEKLFSATKNLVIQSTNNSLAKCTICKKGDLIITSNSRNRALICSNSVNESCVVKASLPRFGLIKIYKKSCMTCLWPKIKTVFKGNPWIFCINPNCPSKKKRKL